MKANINGVTVEGTPQEIMEYERLVKGEKPKSLQESLSKLSGSLENLNNMTQIARKLGVYKKNTPMVGQPNKFAKGTCWAALNGGCNCSGACQT